MDKIWRDMKRIKEFFWAISGHQKEIISDTKVDGYRAMVVGAMLLMVGIYATFAWTFFFSTVIHSFILAFVCGLFAGFFILLFDRALICSLSYGKMNVWALSFRFALALLLGVFLSQPIILKLYEPDVKREAVILIDNKIQDKKEELDKIYSSEVKTLNERKLLLTSILAQKQQQLVANEESFKKEMDGSGGTGRWGYNTVSQKKEGIYKNNVADYERIKNENTPEIKRIDSRLDTIQNRINSQLTDFESTNRNQGFLIQAEALQSMLVKDKTHTLRNRYYLLMIILTLIELSALISKLILTTRSYSEKVGYIIEKEIKELDVDRDLLFNKLDLYKKHTLERESTNIAEFFEKTTPTKDAKMDKLIEEWGNSADIKYKDAWDTFFDNLMIHKN